MRVMLRGRRVGSYRNSFFRFPPSPHASLHGGNKNCYCIIASHFVMLSPAFDLLSHLVQLFVRIVSLLVQRYLPAPIPARPQLLSCTSTDYHRYRFTAEQIRELVDVLQLKLAGPLTTNSRDVYEVLEGTCLLLCWQSHPRRLADMTQMFGRSAAAIDRILKDFARRLVIAFPYALSMRHPCYTSARFQQYAEAIDRVARIGTRCRIFGFVDGSHFPIAKPAQYEQLYFCHKGFHSLNFIVIGFPDGMIVSTEAFPGLLHDSVCFANSAMFDQVLRSARDTAGSRLYLYADPGFATSEVVMRPYFNATPNSPQKAFNNAMSGVRISVENLFAIVKSLWKRCDQRTRLSASTPLFIHTAFMFTNIHNIFNTNAIATRFGVEPMTLNEYLQ
jgi:hypothetical protein